MGIYTLWILSLTAVVGLSAFWIAVHRSRKLGVLWALIGIVPLGALSAVTIGLPVPFRGWERGWQWIDDVPFILFFYTFTAKGVPAVALVAVALVIGLSRRNDSAGDQ